MKQKISIGINYLNLFSAILLTATSIYSFTVQRYVFVLFFFSYFVEIFLDKKWQNIHLDKKSLYYLVMIFFFLLALVYYPFENTSKYFVGLICKRLSIFGFAVVGLFGVNNKYKLSYFLNTFVISSVIAILYLLFFRIGITEFISNPIRMEVFTLERIKYVNSHMVFNFYLNISLISIWYILTRSWHRTPEWKRYLYLSALTIIFSILSFSEGRSGFLMGTVLMLSFIFFEIWKRRKVMGIVIGFLIPFMLIGLASNHKRLSEKAIETEPRLFLWESALSVVEESSILGNGISNAQELYDVERTKYQTEQFRIESQKSYRVDCHNQYLQTTMEFGIIGLLILLFLYIYPIYIADRNRRLFAILLLTLCAYQSVFDMFITGQFSSIFGILVILILSVDNNVAINSSKKIIKS